MNYERVADHCSNLAVYMIQMEDSTMEAHGYLDSLSDVPELKEQPVFGYLRLIAKEYALGIHAGTPEQTACIRKGYALGEYPSLEYRLFGDAHKKYLEKNNMLNVQLSLPTESP